MNYNIKKNYLMNVVAVTILCFLFFSIRPAYAQEQYVDYIYLNDGSKIKVITIIEENREVLTNLVAHDYESMDTTYTGNKTSIVNVLAKYDACVARYEVANGALAPTIFGNEDTTIAVVVVIITLAAITALVGFYYYDKRRRVNK